MRHCITGRCLTNLLKTTLHQREFRSSKTTVKTESANYVGELRRYADIGSDLIRKLTMIGQPKIKVPKLRLPQFISIQWQCFSEHEETSTLCCTEKYTKTFIKMNSAVLLSVLLLLLKIMKLSLTLN